MLWKKTVEIHSQMTRVDDKEEDDDALSAQEL